MAGTLTIDVILHPPLTGPLPPFDDFLRAGMTTSVERVRSAGEGNIATRTRAGGGAARWGPRRGGVGGYGPLAGSVTTKVASFTTPGDAAVVGYVRTITFYARFLEGGATGHPIGAKHQSRSGRPGTLRFGSPTDPAFRRRVTHPGIQPRFMMRDAADGQRAATVTEFETQTRRWAAAVQTGKA